MLETGLVKIRERIFVLADIFMGVVHSHEKFSGAEERAVKALLADLMLMKEENLPAELLNRLAAFNPQAFDLAAAARDFFADPPMKKRRLLELVARISNVGDEYDVAGDDYLRTLAEHLQMQPSEYHDLVLDIEIEELRQSFHELVIPPLPPPVPSSAPKSAR